MTLYTLTINWPAIHDCMKKIDTLRWGTPTPIGYDGTCDVFGGNYTPHYEVSNVAGAVQLYNACRLLRGEVHEIVRCGHHALEIAAAPTESDRCNEYWSICISGDKLHNTHRGASWRATYRGGKVEVRKVIDQKKIDYRVSLARKRIRIAIRIAILIDEAMRLFADAGLCEYYPQTTICGVHEGLIRLTGIRWMQGHRLECDVPPTVEEALAI